MKYSCQFKDATTAISWTNDEMTTVLIVALQGSALKLMQMIPTSYQDIYESW